MFLVYLKLSSKDTAVRKHRTYAARTHWGEILFNYHSYFYENENP